MAMKIGASEIGGTFYMQAGALAELYNRGRRDGEKCLVEPTFASIDNANRLDRGEIDFGFMASNWIGRAKDGAAPFEKKIPLRMLSPANAGPIFFVALAASPIETVSDLRGKRVALGGHGSGMAQHAEAIFDALEISLGSLTPVYLGFADGAEALIKGRVDAQFQCPVPNPVMTDLSERADVRVVRYAPGQLEKISSAAPFYRKVVMEKSAFRGLGEEVAQLGVVNVIVTHERTSEEAVHELAQTIAENLDALPKMNPLFKGIEALFRPLRERGAAAFEFGGVPLHAGAVRAYREAGWLR